ncbi:protein-glutamate methylesterase/protein-glutamine glutaminase [Enterococcus italicus]|uniref:protein-glutamate methylesterase/protein-glutamine glutaminase n=1 Tax=Enterococcus italicus TaxID=246144 RepID=UPI0028AEBC5B|nr:chemotaxis response regulator protein-glutamate methylesterase [Enterococcus italicus]
MIKILVVDDSAFMRKVVTDLITDFPDMEVVGTARNGKYALQWLEANQADMILMDVEMPVMNGIEALTKIKQAYATPVIMLSSLSMKEVTIEALALGAADFVEKPLKLMSIDEEWVRDFSEKIRSIFQKNKLMDYESSPVINEFKQPTINNRQLPVKIDALVIGASTGGPRALLRVIQQLPPCIKMPIFIVQHMPKGFTASFAQRLDTETKVTVREVTDQMVIENCVYLCPGDYHMTIKNNLLQLNQQPKLHGTRPAVDYLFSSAASRYHQNLVAILLTGMGRDGAAGMKDIKNYDGYTIAQDKESSVVFGMPRYAIEQKVVDEVLSLDKIAKKIRDIVR